MSIANGCGCKRPPNYAAMSRSVLLSRCFGQSLWSQMCWAGVGVVLVVGLTGRPGGANEPVMPESRSQAAAGTLFDELLRFPTPSGLSSEFYNRVDPDRLVTDETVSATTMTLPSLWLNRDGLPDQLGSNRLIREWLAYQSQDGGIAAVDVIVNSQIWAALTYGERFAVLTQFATAAETYGYNVRLLRGSTFDLQIVGLYACTSTLPTPPPTLACKASIDPGTLLLEPSPPPTTSHNSPSRS